MSKAKDKVSVVLAYPYPHDAEKPKYDADETVELPAVEAQQLIRDGYARPTTTKKES